VERLLGDDEIPPGHDRAPHRHPGVFSRGTCLRKFPDQISGASWSSILMDTGEAAVKRLPMRIRRGGRGSWWARSWIDRTVRQNSWNGWPGRRAARSLPEKGPSARTQHAAGYPACSGTRCGVPTVRLTRPRVPIQRMVRPPGIWTFLSSPVESGFFSSLVGHWRGGQAGGVPHIGFRVALSPNRQV